MTKFRPVVLIILDGWGLSPSWGGNALMMNNPKNIDHLWREYPHKILQALGAIEYGNVVGESRLGHLMLGAGRPVSGSHSLINAAIKEKKFFKNKVLKEAISWAKNKKSNLHLLGMISAGGVHSDIDHLLALLELAHRENFDRVFIDVITDGIDSGPTDALKFAAKIDKKIHELGVGKFSTVAGRYFAMDRDEHWDRIKKMFDCLTLGVGKKYETVQEAISQSYREGVTDEFIKPTILGEPKPIKKNDAVIFFNFREDRAKQLTRVFTQKNFRVFLWKPIIPENLFFATFTNYQKNLPCKVVFPGIIYKNGLSEVLAELGSKQLKVAESEKVSHVTSFFNGGREESFAHEERKIISSPDVASFDLRPEMSAEEVSRSVCKAIEADKYDFILVNFANVDMVAHTGNILAVGQAVQVLDKEVQKIVEANLKARGATIVTADHGNAEQMININQNVGERETLHTLNPVPFILITPKNKKNLLKISITYEPNALSKIIQAKDSLADVAPTILELLNIPKPKEMTGKTLIGRLE
jgi:2,3-bisphosphoglycerate-independent phosphoglycerate mutase